MPLLMPLLVWGILACVPPRALSKVSETEISRLTQHMRYRYSLWSLKKKMIFHHNLLKGLEEVSLGVIDQEASHQKISSNWLGEFLISSAQADGKNQGAGQCLFGGWPSYFQRGTSRCLAPWNSRILKRRSGKEKYLQCGHPGVVRCNGVLFGNQNCLSALDKNHHLSRQQGCCIKVDGSEVSSVDIIRSCLRQSFGRRNDFGEGILDRMSFQGSRPKHRERRKERIKKALAKNRLDMNKIFDHVEGLTKNSRKMGEYIALTAAVLQHCDDTKGFCGKFHCQNILQVLEEEYSPDVFDAGSCLIDGSARISDSHLSDMITRLGEVTKAAEQLEAARIKGALLRTSFNGEFWKGGCLPHDLVEREWKHLRRRSRSCRSDMQDMEKAMLENTDWAGLSEKQRAAKIYSLAKKVYREMKQAAGKKWISSAKIKKGRVNPHAFYSFVGPELISCIAFEETSGTLNPLAHNYTYCKRPTTSTAHGLTQITGTTLVDVFKRGHIPRQGTTARGRIVQDLRVTPLLAHSAMSVSPEYQLELGLRTINSKAKGLGKKGRGSLLGRSIRAYDTDQAKKYVPSVVKCYSCLKKVAKKRGGEREIERNVWKCYQNGRK